MFLVGAVLFALYIYFTAWNIIHNNKIQDEERYSHKDNSYVDEADTDGMGNFSRFPKE